MSKFFNFLFLFLLVFSFSLVSANPETWQYNYLEQGDRVQYGGNYSINVNTSDNWNTNIGVLSGVNTSQFSNEGGLLTAIKSWWDGLYCELTGCDIVGDVSITGETKFNGRVNITTTDSNVDISALQTKTTNDFGAASHRFLTSDDDKMVMGIFSETISQLLFPQLLEPGQVVGGLTMDGGPLFLVSQENNTIEIGATPTKDITLTEFFIRFDPLRQGITFQGDKHIQPKIADGGSALVFDSEDVLDAGGFPFVFEAQDSNNVTIILSWQQNGANNSFSGQMNSFGLFPKSWIQATSNGDMGDNVTFLFNTSNYVQYCDYLQTNLSLVPEGCKYFADTSGRLVPLLFGGDLEVHRTATIHEALTVFNDFDFITRENSDADFFFNGDNPGKVHIRDGRSVLANITNFSTTITDFDDGSISPFVSESVAPETGRDWASVLEAECHQDRCANAKGGNEKVMAFSDGTEGATNINISFWATTNLLGGDTLEVTLDDNEGNTNTPITISTSVTDQYYSFIMPGVFENKSNVTTRFILNGINIVREVWVDDVKFNAIFDPSRIINETYDGGRLVLGEDRGNVLSCAIDVEKIANNETLTTEWVMNLGSPDCAVNFVGNVSFTDSTVENQTVIGDQNVTGNMYVGGDLFVDGTIDGYVPYTGATSNVNLGVYDLTATDITATNIIFGGQTLSSLSTGTADNTKLVTQGYVDDNDLWETQTATRIGLKSPYNNIRGTFDLEVIGQVVATTGDFTNLRASNFEPTSLTTSDLTIDNGGTLEIKEAVAWTSISDLWIKWDNEEIRFGAGTNGDVRQYFSGSDFYIDSRDTTANDELRFTDFDEYNFDNDVVVDGKLYLENSSNGYIEWIGGTNESIGFYNSTGGFTTIEVDGVYVHSFTTNLTDEEAYYLVENANDNNKSSWGECYNQKLVPDLTRPEIEFYDVELCEIELVEDCVTKNESVWIFDGEFYQRGINETTTCEMVPNYEIELVEGYQPFVNSTGYFLGYEKVNIEKKVPLPPVCINETRNQTIYPHEILSESLDLECKQVMNEKADKHRVNTKIILANEIHTNTTKDLDTMTKIENFRETLKTKTFQEIKDFVIDATGKLSNNILMDTELSEYGSYDLGAITHFNRAMVIFLMKENLNQAEEIQELKDKEAARDACWDLNTQAEIIACMRAI